MSKATFHETLEELMGLFKVLKDHAKSTDGEFDISFINDFDTILSNYNLLADGISDEMIDQVGAPLKDMVEVMVEQLREEVDRINVVDEADQKEMLKDELQSINQKLENCNPASREVDALLDRRTELVKELRAL